MYIISKSIWWLSSRFELSWPGSNWTRIVSSIVWYILSVTTSTVGFLHGVYSECRSSWAGDVQGTDFFVRNLLRHCLVGSLDCGDFEFDCWNWAHFRNWYRSRCELIHPWSRRPYVWLSQKISWISRGWMESETLSKVGKYVCIVMCEVNSNRAHQFF